MDRKPVPSPAAESIVRREVTLMGVDPDDLDRYLAQAQAQIAPVADPVPVAADASGRLLLLPRPFRLSEHVSERVRPIPALQAALPG